MKIMEPRVVVDVRCVTGENPYWHPLEKRMYWVDIPQGHLYRWDPAGGDHEMFDAGAPVGGFTVQPDGQLLLFMARGAIRFWRDGAFTGTVIDELPGELDNRFNDVIADPEGRVFCGTMSTPDRKGRLYRLDLDGSIHQLLDGVGVSNGLGFSPDGQTLYYTDTTAYAIYAFDYDRKTGDIRNQRVHIDANDGHGKPDGMTVDAEGCIWSARWDGNCIVRYSPEGRQLDRIEFPVHKVSSLTFGGNDYSDIYLTTARGNERGPVEGEYAGSLFHLASSTRGVPEFYSRIVTPPSR